MASRTRAIRSFAVLLETLGRLEGRYVEIVDASGALSARGQLTRWDADSIELPPEIVPAEEAVLFGVGADASLALFPSEFRSATWDGSDRTVVIRVADATVRVRDYLWNK